MQLKLYYLQITIPWSEIDTIVVTFDPQCGAFLLLLHVGQLMIDFAQGIDNLVS